jgi:hypothetical protein
MAVYCVDKLKRRGIVDPTAYLAKDLETRVGPETVMSGRMQLADALARLDALDVDDPLDPLRWKLAQAGLIQYEESEPWAEVPEVWGIKKVDAWMVVVEQVIDEVEEAIEAERERRKEALRQAAALEEAAIEVVRITRERTGKPSKLLAPAPGPILTDRAKSDPGYVEAKRRGWLREEIWQPDLGDLVSGRYKGPREPICVIVTEQAPP